MGEAGEGARLRTVGKVARDSGSYEFKVRHKVRHLMGALTVEIPSGALKRVMLNNDLA